MEYLAWRMQGGIARGFHLAVTATPDRRAYELDTFDAFCRRQLARIHKNLATQEKKRIQLRSLRDPGELAARGRIGYKTLSELDGDERE